MVLRKIFAATAIALALVFVAGAAHAGTLTVSDSGHRQGDGGEFRVTEYDTYYTPPDAAVNVMQPGGSGTDFLTFCIEWTEHINLPGTYNYDTQIEAIGGSYNLGPAGPNGGDPIGVATAKLFYAYWTGQLASFDVSATTYNFRYGSAATTATEITNRKEDGEQLQIAIWSLEDEEGAGAGSPDPDASGNELAAAFIAYANSVSWASLGEDWGVSSTGGVRALNLYELGTGANKQSVLVIVPLPTSALMGAALLAAMALVMYRRRLSVG